MLATWTSTFRIPSMCAMSWACRQIFQAPFQAYVLCFPNTLAILVLNSFLRGVRLFPCVGVRLSGCLHLSPRLPVWQFIYLPSLAGGVRLSSSVFTCLPTWLVVSESLAACLHLSLFVCPALLLSVFSCIPFIFLPVWLVVSGCLASFVSFHLSLSLFCVGRLSGFISIYLFPRFPFYLLPKTVYCLGSKCSKLFLFHLSPR